MAPKGDVSIACPSVPAATSLSGGPVPVTFESPTIKAGSNSAKATCTPASGSAFPLGNTKVTCTPATTLAAGASCTFTVSVLTAPRLAYSRFLAFGDSITEGKISEPVPGNTLLLHALALLDPETRAAILEQRLVTDNPKAYPALLQGKLGARYQQQSFTVFNEGLGGEYATEGAARFPGMLAAYNPEVVLLMEGTNDMLDSGRVDPAVAAIDQMAQLALSQGRKVCIATIAPIRSTGSRGAQSGRVPGYNDKLRTLAASRNIPVVDVYNALKDDVLHLIGIDDLHPTEKGYDVISTTFADRIRLAFEQAVATGQTPK